MLEIVGKNHLEYPGKKYILGCTNPVLITWMNVLLTYLYPAKYFSISAPCVGNIQTAVEHIFPLVYAFKMDLDETKKVKSSSSLKVLQKKRPNTINYKMGPKKVKYEEDFDPESDEYDTLSEEDSDDYGSDESFD
jgi:hypothetical protein